MPRVTVRVDRLVVGLCEAVVKREVEPRLHNVPLWNSGFGEVVAAVVEESRVPKKEFSILDLARAAGVLRRRAV
jgi:hypothetical protein